MKDQAPYYISRIQYAFECKKEVNENYSLRSFARNLDISPGTLSRILKKERIPSLAMGKKIALYLKMNKKEEELFLNSLANEKWEHAPQRQSQDLKNFSALDASENGKRAKVYQLELDQYRYLADWIHYGILELTFVSDYSNNPHWMAKKLDRSVEDVKDALERLEVLGLISWENGRWVKTNERITTKDKSKTTGPLKRMQKDILMNAYKAIDDVDYNRRSSVSMTIAVNPGNMKKAQEACIEFSEKLCDLLEVGEQSEIYNLVINLSPVNFMQVKEQ